MTHAYDEMYLEGAMVRIGDMLEYACLDCNYDPDSFWSMFIRSGIARRAEIGDVSIIAGKSGPEIAYMVLAKEDYKRDFPTPMWREDRSDLYWCGWVLSYYQWSRDIPFSNICNCISIKMLQRMYSTLHEADINKTVSEIDKLIKPKVKQPVQGLRILRGLTQQELANKAHMSISQLQRIEYGERKIENLTLKTAISLAKALGIDVDELS